MLSNTNLMKRLESIKKCITEILERREPLRIFEQKFKKMLDRWNEEFSDYQVEEIVVDVKLGIRFGRAALRITMKKK